jgi:general secretion pathway protein D
MPRNRLSTFAALLLTFAIGHAAAQPGGAVVQPAPQAQGQQAPQQPGQQPVIFPPQAPPMPRVNPELPTVELAPLLQRVERASNKRFLVDGRIGPQIYLAGVDPNDVTYPVLLSILRANGFAVFEAEGHVNIVPDADIRFYPTRIVQADDASIPADEFVTRVVTVTNIEGPFLIPILRPLLSQAAHLAAMGTSNRIIIMDRYANVQRITEIIRSLDVPPRN